MEPITNDKIADGPGGEVRILVDGKWVKPDQVGDSPDGRQAFTFGNRTFIANPEKAAPTANTGVSSSPLTSLFNLGVKELGQPAVRAAGEFLGREPVTDQTGKSLPELFDPTAGILQPSDAKGITGGPAGKLTLEIMGESDPAKRAELINETIPGAKAFSDPQGNVIIDITRDGKTQRAILNQRGLSFQDANEVLGEVIKFATIGKFTGSQLLSKAGAVSTLPKQALKGAASIFGVSLAETKDAPTAATNAALGAIFVGGGGLVLRKVRELARRKRLFVKGALSAEGRNVLKNSNINPDDLTPGTLKVLQDVLPKAKNVDEAIALAEARGLNVTLTKGQVTQDPRRQFLESQAVKGTDPSDAAGDLRQFAKGSQRTELARAAQSTADRVAGRPVSTTKGENLGVAQKEAFEQSETLRRVTNQAFETAKSGNLVLRPSAGKPLLKEVDDIAEGTIVGDAAKLAKELRGHFRGKTVDLNKLEVWRKKVSSLGRAAGQNAEQKFVAGQLKRAYDKFLRNIDPSDVRAGDPAAIEAFQKGRQLRALRGEKFQDDPNISAILKTRFNPATKKQELTVEPSEAVDKLLGTGLGKQGSTASFRKLKDILGASSDEWKAVKGEVVLRAFNQGSRNQLEKGIVTGKGFGNVLDSLLTKRPELADVVLTKAEQNALKTLDRVIQRATVPGPATNFSNTDNARMINRAMNLLPPNVREFLSALPVLRNFQGLQTTTAAREALDAKRLLTPITPRSGLLGVPALQNRDPLLNPGLNSLPRLLQSQ